MQKVSSDFNIFSFICIITNDDNSQIILQTAQCILIKYQIPESTVSYIQYHLTFHSPLNNYEVLLTDFNIKLYFYYFSRSVLNNPPFPCFFCSILPTNQFWIHIINCKTSQISKNQYISVGTANFSLKITTAWWKKPQT